LQVKNSSNNEKFWRILKIAAGAILALVAVVYGYGRLNHRVETLEKIPPKVELHGEAIIKIQTDIEYIKQSVTRIEVKLNDSN